MLNNNLEALPSQIRAKSLACAVPAAQNDPQKPRTTDINFGGYWPERQGKRSVLNIRHNGSALPSICRNTLVQIKCDGHLLIQSYYEVTYYVVQVVA